MDTYAADVSSWRLRWTCRNAVHVGHSTGGGEVAHYVARAEPGRVAKAVLVGAVPPVMVKKDSNPGGTPIEVFDGYRAALDANRAQLYLDIADGPLLRLQPSGREGVSEGMIRNWWRQGMMGGVKAQLRLHQGLLRDGLHRGPDADRRAGPADPRRGRPGRAICGFGAARGQAAEERHAEELPGLPHGCMTTHPELINRDILEFVRGCRQRRRQRRSSRLRFSKSRRSVDQA